MKKRFLLIVLIICFCFGLLSCYKDSEETQEETNNSVENTVIKDDATSETDQWGISVNVFYSNGYGVAPAGYQLHNTSESGIFEGMMEIAPMYRGYRYSPNEKLDVAVYMFSNKGTHLFSINGEKERERYDLKLNNNESNQLQLSFSYDETIEKLVICVIALPLISKDKDDDAASGYVTYSLFKENMIERERVPFLSDEYYVKIPEKKRSSVKGKLLFATKTIEEADYNMYEPYWSDIMHLEDKQLYLEACIDKKASYYLLVFCDGELVEVLPGYKQLIVEFISTEQAVQIPMDVSKLSSGQHYYVMLFIPCENDMVSYNSTRRSFVK